MLIFIMNAIFSVLIFNIPTIVARMSTEQQYISFDQIFEKNYMKMNTPKYILRTTLYMLINAIVFVSAFMLPMTKTIMIILFGVLQAINLTIIFLFAQHCAFDLCEYKSKRNIENGLVDELHFVGIGDPQLWKGKDKRMEKNSCVVERISTMTGPTPRFVISTGDCTQTSRDGSFILYNNSIGDYEGMYHHDLKIQMYECLGNHDHDSNGISKPSVNMINRLNKHRRIHDQDANGNYSVKIRNLLIIFVDTWPSYNKMYSSKPKHSVNFLRKSLNNMNADDRWILVTHYVPNPAGWDDSNFIKSDTFNIKGFEEFYELFTRYKDQCVCVMHGHIHTKNLLRHRNQDGCDIYILPSPVAAEVNNGQVSVYLAMFTFNFKTNRLSVSEIDGVCS
jgi:Icc-related predicted phosphoesterase